MAKADKTPTVPTPSPAPGTPPPVTGDYNLPIEQSKSGLSAGSTTQARRVMILLALVLALVAAGIVWWLSRFI